MAEKINIGGELHSVATEHKVADVAEIKDATQDNKSQAEINTENSIAFAERYTKEETYNKAELNSLITTPNQEYVTVAATDQTTAVTDVLPAVGSADTVYRVGNWDGSQFDVTVYSEYAWDGTQYIHLSTKTQIGEVFDISAYNATGGALAIYTDLADALSGTNVPTSIRRGGMSVKFILSSDNKYVQARCMAQNFTTDVTQWQEVDNKPVAGSNNLVESGGVLYEIEQKQKEIDSINDALNNKVTQLGSYSYNSIGQWQIQTISPQIPAGRIYFVIQSENQQTVFLNNLQFRQGGTAAEGDTNLANLTCVCGKRYYVDTTNSSLKIVIKATSALTITLLGITALSENRIEKNQKDIKSLSDSSFASSGSVESDFNIGFTISGNIIDGIHIANSNWRHTDFIEITELGHNIYSTLHKSSPNLIFFYSSNSEDSYIGAISGISFTSSRESFINHKAFVSISNCIPNAKYFRAVSYKDDTYADGLRLGVYALSQKELESYINKLHNSKSHFDKRINYVGHSIWWYDGRELAPSTTGTGGSEIAIGYQSLLEMVFGFAAKGNYCYSGNSLGGTSAADTASIMNHSDEWEGTSDDIWTLDCATNDFKRNIPLGTINNYTNKTGITTFYGALREYNDKVNSLSNNATVICSNAIARNNSGYTSTSINTVGCKLSDYGNAIKEIARLNGWIFIDQFNSCGITDDNVFNYTIDGLHLNNAGYLIAVMPWIETLMEVYQNLYIKAKEVFIDESVGTDLLQVVDRNNRRVAEINKNGELFTNIIDLGLYLEEGDLNDYDKVINNTLTIANLFDEYDGTGKTLYLPNGIWSIATGITIRSGINFVGASRSAILKVKHSLTHSLGAVFGYDGTSVDNPIKNVEFRNFTIDMSDYILSEYESWNVNQKGIFCQYMNNCTIDNVCIIGSPATAIGVDFLVNCRVTNNTLINCGKYWANKTAIHEGVGGCAGIGIGTGGYTNENLVITNNECINCGQFGIFIENQGEAFGGQDNKPAKGIIISNNVVRETRRHGIGVRGARSVVVSENEVYENYGSGIFLELICKDVLISDNNISKNGLIDDSDELDFTIDSQRYGIAFHPNTDADNVVISSNSIYQNKNGLCTKGSNLNAVVIKNNNSDNAVRIESGTSVSSVVGNIIRGDFYIYGTHTSLCFKDNVIYGNTQKVDITFDGDNRFNDIY